jgi:transcriptional regulator with XRE-family HTH domain
MIAAQKEKPMSSKAESERIKLGERLREAREYLQLSQDEVARALGVPRAAISLIESGQRKVEALELKKLAQVYQRPVSHFTGGDQKKLQLPTEVEHLARKAAELSDRDRAELAQFADYLKSRAASAKD